jgi:phage gp46-like protein
MEKLFLKATSDELKEASKLLTESYSEKNASVPICVNDIPIFIPYKNGWKTARFVGSKLHLGQRKLFLNKLQFLTESLPTKDSRAWVVYAGAAPSVPVGLLASLFPKVRFLLVDPNPFYTANVHPVILDANNITGSAKEFLGEKTNKYIYILNGLFTEELASELQQVAKQYARDILFI